MVRRNNIFVLLLAMALLMPVIALADESAQSGKPLSEALDDVCVQTESLLSRKLAAHPDDVPLRVQYADMLLDNGKLDVALLQYTKAHEMDGNNAGAIIGMACCHDRQGHSQLALVECRQACQVEPSNPEAVAVYLAVTQKYNRLGEALPVLKTLVSVDKSKAARACRLAAEWTVEQDYRAAQSFAKEAHNLDPKAYPREDVSIQLKNMHFRDSKNTRNATNQSWGQRFSLGGRNGRTQRLK